MKKIEKLKDKEMLFFTLFSIVVLIGAALLAGNPGELWSGMVRIIVSRDALITDYFVLGGPGGGLLNAAVVLSICTLVVVVQKIPFTGPTMAALFINAGYGLWGKNPLNILPILLGTWLYAKSHNARLSRYIYTALFGTCLAPFVTEMMYLLPFSMPVRLGMAVLTGIFIGFVLPPLSVHTASMHMGYNLFNVGFSAGVLAFVMVCVFRSFGLESETLLLWQEGISLPMAVGLYGYFLIAIVFGCWQCGGNLRQLLHIFKHPGRAVADFVLMDGVGATLMNMGLVGIIGTTYIICIGGDFSGPVVGAIWMMFGFAAFGAHVKNYLPVLLGVFLFAVVCRYSPTTPGLQLAALFAVGLAPIAGQFGIVAGILAGMLHAAIVMCTSGMYGGLNLYNNGFSAGWVAIFLVPVAESFMKHFNDRRQRRKEAK